MTPQQIRELTDRFSRLLPLCDGGVAFLGSRSAEFRREGRVDRLECPLFVLYSVHHALAKVLRGDIISRSVQK